MPGPPPARPGVRGAGGRQARGARGRRETAEGGAAPGEAAGPGRAVGRVSPRLVLSWSASVPRFPLAWDVLGPRGEGAAGADLWKPGDCGTAPARTLLIAQDKNPEVYGTERGRWGFPAWLIRTSRGNVVLETEVRDSLATSPFRYKALVKSRAKQMQSESPQGISAYSLPAARIAASRPALVCLL